MIIDLQKFIREERGHWQALEEMLDRMEADAGLVLSPAEVRRFHYLYQRTSAGLARLATFAAEPETHRYLESLVARAYGEIQETRRRPHRFSPLAWFFMTLPRTFRLHSRAFWLAVALTFAGASFGGLAVGFDPDAKKVLMPFPNLQGDPSARVAKEEKTADDRLKGVKMTGAAWYMTHNTRVSFFTMALGVTYGVGTVIMLFYNGVILGAVVADYVMAGQSTFLAAWLSPHGVIEIPAILLAGQAGLVLAGALIGWGTRVPVRTRLRMVSKDLITLCSGVGLMLIWAGVIEAFVSQYHEPVLPYSLKIGFGLVEFVLLVLYLALAGRKKDEDRATTGKGSVA
ncbi:MAG: stage II sporulation protein M [Thermodesulfovibrionales bacterium]